MKPFSHICRTRRHIDGVSVALLTVPPPNAFNQISFPAGEIFIRGRALASHPARAASVTTIIIGKAVEGGREGRRWGLILLRR